MTHPRCALSGLWFACASFVVGATCPAQKYVVEELLAEARAAHGANRPEDAVIALHGAALACGALGEEEGEALRRVEELAKEIDPLLESRRAEELEIAKILVAVARKYRDRKLPRCAVDLLRDAKRLDLSVEDELLRTEGLVHTQPPEESATDKAMHDLLWTCFHPYGWAMLLRRESPRDQARSRDKGFDEQLMVRAVAAAKLLKQAEAYARAGLWRVAFSIVNEAIMMEPEVSFPAGRELVADYREQITGRARDERTAVWKRSTRTGRWKRVGKSALIPPPLGDRPVLLLSKTTLEPPYGVQVDIDLDQQPGGGGLVVAAQDKENYLAVELNTIGIGISVYLSQVIEGERTVIAGTALTHSSSTPESVRGNPEHLYNAWRLGLPLTLKAEVKDGEIVVSTLLQELFRADLPGEIPGSGSYGLVRVSYVEPRKDGKSNRRRRTDYKMEFDNLLVEGGT